MKPIVLLLALGLVLGSAGCGKHDDHDHAAEGHEHHHVHTPKMGGQLIEIGEHEFNLELLRDTASGKLNAWVLDAHAENFVRVPNESLLLTFTVSGKEEVITLKPVANAATGETIGNTSQFEGQGDWLKSSAPLSGKLLSFVIRDKGYTNITFQLGK